MGGGFGQAVFGHASCLSLVILPDNLETHYSCGGPGLSNLEPRSLVRCEACRAEIPINERSCLAWLFEVLVTALVKS